MASEISRFEKKGSGAAWTKFISLILGLEKQAAEQSDRIRDLLEVWAAETRDPDRQKEARALFYGLGR